MGINENKVKGSSLLLTLVLGLSYVQTIKKRTPGCLISCDERGRRADEIYASRRGFFN